MKKRLQDDFYTTGQLLVVRGELIYAAPKAPRLSAARFVRPGARPFRTGIIKHTAVPVKPK